MIFSYLIAFFTLSFLILLHEFSHFLVAKKYKVKVEEFGIGLPPRIFGKKFGETIYSINFLPFGGFVKLLGENETIEKEGSFSQKPVWQRIQIVGAGIVSFWIFSWIIFTFLFVKGIPQAISDSDQGNLIDPRVQIVFVSPNSPAENANLKVGDIIREVETQNSKVSISRVKELQQVINENKGKEITLTIERGKKIFKTKIVPRVETPEGEGPIGIFLSRISTVSFPWYIAPFKAIERVAILSKNIVLGTFLFLKDLIFKKRVSGVEVAGPLRIGQMLAQMQQAGFRYYLSFLGTISIYLAIFNLLPIPALDGGKLLFLVLEKIRRKPVSPQLEQKITAFFFFLLLTLMILVTIKDIKTIF
jgi:regulator of sigma E protease